MPASLPRSSLPRLRRRVGENHARPVPVRARQAGGRGARPRVRRPRGVARVRVVRGARVESDFAVGADGGVGAVEQGDERRAEDLEGSLVGAAGLQAGSAEREFVREAPGSPGRRRDEAQQRSETRSMAGRQKTSPSPAHAPGGQPRPRSTRTGSARPRNRSGRCWRGRTACSRAPAAKNATVSHLQRRPALSFEHHGGAVTFIEGAEKRLPIAQRHALLSGPSGTATELAEAVQA